MPLIFILGGIIAVALSVFTLRYTNFGYIGIIIGILSILVGLFFIFNGFKKDDKTK